ncbi:MAG: hypothetical protein N3D75_03085 [Candidatus Aenigmarchaeota archaeon]|nr:hypothetical protein [Candidatus Aenigmarchaeota archaeon]
MKKGLNGYIIAFVITLILAAIGITLVWVFLKNTTEGASLFSQEVFQKICSSSKIIKTLMGC